MAAEEDSEECTCKLLSTITQTTSRAAAQMFVLVSHLMADCQHL